MNDSGIRIEFVDDPTQELLRRKREIDREIDARLKGHPAAEAMDERELAERQEAAWAYTEEDERHFVDYLADCLKQSVEGHKEIRRIQSYCYRVYKENEPVNYARKESWQSRIVVPKPFATVQYGASAIKKAFTPKFLSLSNVHDKAAGDFWEKVMTTQLNEQHAKFILRFTDATTMGLAVGISQEMIPRWVPGRGLEYVLIEPWKIHRDPDALSRDCQSGLFWIHQEWLDHYVLKEGEKYGRYENVDRAKEMENEDPNNPFLTKEALAARREMLYQRSGFRTMVLTSEFWGTVLDPKGNLLLPNATYTCAGGRVIQKPIASKYDRIRWPGIAFSPLPDLLAFNGRGLLEGVLSVWEAMCNLMCLHFDNLMWLVNPMTEICTDLLKDPRDAETYPGKEYQTSESVSGQQAVRTVERRSVTNDVLANMQYYDQNFQRGSLVTDAVQGLPGYRKDMTYREAAMNLDQAMGVYSLMGENIEQGAIEAIVAGAELTAKHATYADYLEMLGPEAVKTYGIAAGEGNGGVAGVPPIDGSFHVSGIQALMRENETLMNLRTVIVPLASVPRFAPYIKPYNTLKAIEVRTNLADEKVICTEAEAKAIDAATAQAQADELHKMEEAHDLAQAHGMADLAGKMGGAAGTAAKGEE